MTEVAAAEGADYSGMLRGRHVAVTGAAGFIGSRLAGELARGGARVVAIDCLVDAPYPSNVRQAAWDRITGLEGITGHRLDLRSDRLEPTLADVEIVFHLAAVAGMDDMDPTIYRSCNVEATERLAEACIGAGVSRVIHASTSSVYGEVAVGDEASALEPVSEYGRTKLKAEELLEEVCSGSGPDLTVLRLFSVYGPGQRPNMAYYRIIDAAFRGEPFKVFGDGLQSRSNTYVDDVVEGILRATSPQAIGETLNIAGGEAVTLNQAIETIERLTGKPVERVMGPSRPGDQLRTEGDWSKAYDLIGFEPLTSFEEGIARQIEWQARTSGR